MEKKNEPFVVTEKALKKFEAEGKPGMRNLQDAFTPERVAAIAMLAALMGKK